jgi:hypothetical protein
MWVQAAARLVDLMAGGRQRHYDLMAGQSMCPTSPLLWSAERLLTILLTALMRITPTVA